VSQGSETDVVMTGAAVYQRLRQEILSCGLMPGTEVRERLIADRYNVSKSPVRDALIKLQEQNLIEVTPRKGYRVASISLRDAREMYDMRLIFERESILRLIDSAETKTLTALERFREGPRSGVLTDWIAYNRAFHSFIAANSGNSRLARAGIEVVEQFDRLTYMSVTHQPDLQLEDFASEHSRIIDAIQARQKRRAVRLAREHIDGSRRRLLDTLGSAPIMP
jgi:GntR family transcriptional regulator, rspAB operon transcriptional repressor